MFRGLQGPAKRHYTRKAVIDVTILPDLDERLLIDVADLRLDPTWTSERHPQEIPDKVGLSFRCFGICMELISLQWIYVSAGETQRCQSIV